MSRYVRKTDRAYTHVTPSMRAQVEEWYATKLALGNQDQIAARVGISVPLVQVICANYRSRHSLHQRRKL